jgi:hypothetical protein
MSKANTTQTPAIHTDVYGARNSPKAAQAGVGATTLAEIK